MNKVYKVVWSKAKNAYVVVSELAKNSTKSGSTKKLLAMLVATGIMMGGFGIAHAGAVLSSPTGATANQASGDYSVVAGGANNTASGAYSVVVGGIYNQATVAGSIVVGGGINVNEPSDVTNANFGNLASTVNSFIGGGASNEITTRTGSDGANAVIVGGFDNAVTGRNAGILVGNNNTSNGGNAAVVGGAHNTANANDSVVVGGRNNEASGRNSFVGAGGSMVINGAEDATMGNTASGNFSAVVSGQQNKSEGLNSFVGAGLTNTVTGSYSGIVTGVNNTITERVGEDKETADLSNSIIGAGDTNTIDNSKNAGILSGNNNTITEAADAVIVGGHNNTITAEQSYYTDEDTQERKLETNSSGILAGDENTITDAKNAAIIAGYENTVTGDNAIVGAGRNNTASGENSAVLAGRENTASGAFSSVLGGYQNTASGNYSTAFGNGSTASGVNSVAGLGGTSAGSDSIALGNKALAEDANNIALGTKANATGDRTIAIGMDTKATDFNGIAIGRGSESLAHNTVAMGHGAIVSSEAHSGIAIGTEAKVLANAADAISIGENSRAYNAFATTMGAQAVSQGVGTTTFGALSNAEGASAVSVGMNASAIGDNTVTVGGNATAAGNNNSVFGANAVAGAYTAETVSDSNGLTDDITDSVADQTVYYKTTVKNGVVTKTAFNSKAEYDAALAADGPVENALVAGFGATVLKSKGSALGANAVVGVEGGVALGSDSVADTDAGEAGYDPITKDASTQDDATWKATAAAVSVGADAADANSKAVTRQITHVAAGTQLTDAVNVAQLQALQQTVTDQHTAVTVNGGTEAPAAGANGAYGDYSTGGNLQLAQKEVDGKVTYDVALSNNVTLGDATENGSLTIKSADGTSTIVANENGLGVKQGDTNFAVNNDGVGANIGDANLSVTKNGVGLSKGDSQMVVNDAGTSFSNGTGSGTTTINGATVTSGKVITDGNEGQITGLQNRTLDVEGFATKGRAATEEQLKAVQDNVITYVDTEVAKAKTTVEEGNNVHVIQDSTDPNNYVIHADNTTVSTDSNLTLNETVETHTDDNGKVLYETTNYEIGLGNDITVGGKDGKDGSIGVKGADGVSGVGINGKDGSIGLTGADGTTVVIKGQNGSDGTPGVDGTSIDRIVYEDGNGDEHEVATLDDGMKFVGDDTSATPVTKKLNETMQIKGDGTNINTSVDDGAIKVALNNNLDLGDNGSVKMGDTTINNNGLTINNGPSVTKDGIDAGGTKITNVAPGEISANSTDAVNGSQLNATNQQVNHNTQNINKLSKRVNKVGAGAAALAALHPLDFDPDDKLTFAAGVGNYKGENAGAVGMFYRPDEKIMFSLGATVGNDDNMVNAGVSFSLDRTARVTNSKTAMAKQILDMQDQLAKVMEVNAQLVDQVNKMSAFMNTTANGDFRQVDASSILFPDIPQNHWAYNYVYGLVERGIIEGYPNGMFQGDRSMTRYEFSAMLYRALLAGDQLNDELFKEFGAEIEKLRQDARFRVDRVHGEDNDKRKVERVRTNGDEKDANGNVTQYRDKYGSKIMPTVAK